MTRLPINYQNALIYKIVCKDLDVKECYIGSTTDFRKRKYAHKTNCNSVKSRQYYLNVYQFIRDNGGWDNWDMILIEKYSCDCKLELLKRERYWIEYLSASLNKNIPSHSQKESQKKWNDKNKDKIIEYQKIYNEDNNERILQRKKKYREANKDKLKEYSKEYREVNKNKINKKINCECGGKYTHNNKSTHIKTTKHKEWVNND